MLATDTGDAIRAWLVFVVDCSRVPALFMLGDRPYTDDETRLAAHLASNVAGRELLQRLRGLTEDQLRALLQQDNGFLDEPLLDRTLRFWDRPRLEGVDWLRCGPTKTATTYVSSVHQDVEWHLVPDSPVMLAGDGFPDVHAVVREDAPDGWVVDLLWNQIDD